MLPLEFSAEEEYKIQNLLNIEGFSREDVEKCLIAAQFDEQKAVKYLIKGIP